MLASNSKVSLFWEENMPQPEENHCLFEDVASSNPQNSKSLFEAPSFMTLVDPKTHALLKAGMPCQMEIISQPSASENSSTFKNDWNFTSPSKTQKPLQMLMDRESRWDNLMESLASPQQPPMAFQKSPGSMDSLSSPKKGISPSRELTTGIPISYRVQNSSPSGGYGHNKSLTGSTWSPKSISSSKRSPAPSSPKKKQATILSSQEIPFVDKVKQNVQNSPTITRNLGTTKNATHKAKTRSVWSMCICC